MSGPVPLIGVQAEREYAAIQSLYNTLFVSMFGVVAGVRLREMSMPEEEWKGESTKPTPGTIAEEARHLALAALNDLTTHRPTLRSTEGA